MNVGFIGLGNMGLPMARNLLKAGHQVTVYNRTRERADSLRGEGAIVASRAADTCAGDAVITMLADDHAVRTVVFGEKLISILPPGTVHISTSTISVALARELAEAHAEAGNQFVSAPVFGRPQAAAEAQLAVVAAGAAKSVDYCQPVLMQSDNARSSWEMNRTMPMSSNCPGISSSFP